MSYPFEVSPTEFKNKRVLVTGGTSGVGLATVKRFAAAGAKVLTTAREKTELPKGVIFVKSDLATAEGTNLVAQEVLSQLGALISSRMLLAVQVLLRVGLVNCLMKTGKNLLILIYFLQSA